MFIVLAELENDLIIQDDTDGTVDPIKKSEAKLLFNLGVSISGFELVGDNMIITPTMQDFVDSDEDDEDEDLYYGDFGDEEEADDIDEDDEDEDFVSYEDEGEDSEEDDFVDDEDLFYGDDDEEYEEESTVSKLYAFLTPDQIKVLKRYYLWYSQRIFTDAQKDPTLGMKSKTALNRKKANLDKLRNQGGLWHYAGFVDMGYKGAGECTLGHPLRYMHLAWDVTVSDIESAFFGENYNDDFEQAIQSNNCIVFGIKCISDFFEVDKECMRALQRAQRESLKDMALMYQYYADNTVSEINSTFDIMDEILKKIRGVEARSALATKDYKPLITPNLIAFYFQFRELNLVPPKSLIQEIRDNMINWNTHKFIYERSNSERKVLHMPNINVLNNLVTKLLGKSKSTNLVNALSESNIFFETEGNIYYYIYTFLSVFFMYKICGYYAYNGDTNTDEGGKNKNLLEMYKKVIRRSQTFSDAEFSIDFLKRLDDFLGNIMCYNHKDIRFNTNTYKYDYDNNLYYLDEEYTKFNSTYVDKYEELNKDTQYELISAIEFYNTINNPYRGSIIRAFNTREPLFKDCEEIARKHRTYLDEHLEKYRDFANALVQSELDSLNKKKLEEKAERERKEEELRIKQQEKEAKDKEKEVLKSFEPKDDNEMLEFLNKFDMNDFDDKKYGFSKKLLKQLTDSGKEPTRNQMFHIAKLYTCITGKTYSNGSMAQSAKEKISLDDREDLKEALTYIVDNKITCENQITFDIISSIVRYKTISEKQMKYAESGLKTYNSLKEKGQL